MKTVGFLANDLCLRGVTVALYDYAYHNQTILGNKSVILSRCDGNKDAYLKFAEHFPIFLFNDATDIDTIVESNSISHLYIAKYGHNDGISSTKCKNIIHCIFSTTEPHGDYYLAVGQTINDIYNTRCEVFPHIVMPPLPNCGSMRQQLGIPENATVFGRHGGADTFDIYPVYDVIVAALNQRPDIYFLFMNTNKFVNHPRIIYLPGTYKMAEKQRFINTCDAMIHARGRGETFGLACAEFDVCDKPVITYDLSPEKEHLIILGDRARTYNSAESLFMHFMSFDKNKCELSGIGYAKYTPTYVMQIFEKYLST